MNLSTSECVLIAVLALPVSMMWHLGAVIVGWLTKGR